MWCEGYGRESQSLPPRYLPSPKQLRGLRGQVALGCVRSCHSPNTPQALPMPLRKSPSPHGFMGLSDLPRPLPCLSPTTSPLTALLSPPPVHPIGRHSPRHDQATCLPSDGLVLFTGTPTKEQIQCFPQIFSEAFLPHLL